MASQTGLTKVPQTDIWSCHKYRYQIANIQHNEPIMLLGQAKLTYVNGIMLEKDVLIQLAHAGWIAQR